MRKKVHFLKVSGIYLKLQNELLKVVNKKVRQLKKFILIQIKTIFNLISGMALIKNINIQAY